MRECLGVVLGVSPPSPEYEALLFFKQWLAERNLGLGFFDRSFINVTHWVAVGLTAYDASYVALAEDWALPLVTADARVLAWLRRSRARSSPE